MERGYNVIGDILFQGYMVEIKARLGNKKYLMEYNYIANNIERLAKLIQIQNLG